MKKPGKKNRARRGPASTLYRNAKGHFLKQLPPDIPGREKQRAHAKKRGKKKKRSPAQMAATRRMRAALKRSMRKTVLKRPKR